MTTSQYRERAVQFGRSGTLVGIVTDPPKESASRLPAAIFLSGGLLSRVGPKRLFVRISRTLALAGFSSLRFDLSGIGDSGVRADHLPLEESVLEETRDAINHLAVERNLDRFVLIGYCSGAWLSLRMAWEDPRIVGALLVNPQGFGEQWVDYDRRRKTSLYYQRRYGSAALRNREKWMKVLTGRADYGSIARNVLHGVMEDRVATLRFKSRDARTTATCSLPPLLQGIGFPSGLHTLAARGVRLTFVYSEGNTGYEYLHSLLGTTIHETIARGDIELKTVPESDHAFTLLRSQDRLVELASGWMQERWDEVS